MAIQIKRRWPAEPIGGLPRRDRQGCEYAVYLPDPLSGRSLTLLGDVAADVADAEAAIVRLNTEARALVDSEALARLLLRAEAVASSRIEGLEVGARRLLRAEAAWSLGNESADVTAEEVLANINAMQLAIGSLADAKEIIPSHLLEIHRRLLGGSRLAERSGRLRTEQNWIGGSSYNPCSAAFVPPPHEQVPELVDDLCSFCNQDLLSPIVQAALVQAQFETIHPFVDGNGRIGRALIHLILRRRGLAPRILPPVSLVLATWSRDYIAGLTATQYVGDPTSDEAQSGLNRWIAIFAAACRRAVDDAHAYERKVSELQTAWRARIGPVRHNSAVDLLLTALPGVHILTAASAAAVIGRSFQAANEAVHRLAAAQILREVRVGRRRNRVFEVPDLIDAFTDLERRLASPCANTLTSPPSRPAPQRGR